MINLDDRLIKEISPKIGPNALSVLLAIAIHLGDKKTCFPSHERLMKLTSIGRDGVYKALEKLKSEGLLTVSQLVKKDGTFGRRTFKVSTRLIGVFIAAGDAPPLTENQEPDMAETDSPLPENPYTVNQETEVLITEGSINHSKTLPHKKNAALKPKDILWPQLIAAFEDHHKQHFSAGGNWVGFRWTAKECKHLKEIRATLVKRICQRNAEPTDERVLAAFNAFLNTAATVDDWTLRNAFTPSSLNSLFQTIVNKSSAPPAASKNPQGESADRYENVPTYGN